MSKSRFSPFHCSISCESLFQFALDSVDILIEKLIDLIFFDIDRALGMPYNMETVITQAHISSIIYFF